MTEVVFLENGAVIQIATSDGEILSKRLASPLPDEFQERLRVDFIDYFEPEGRKVYLGSIGNKIDGREIVSKLIPAMTRVKFLENGTIVEVKVPDGEIFRLKPSFPIPHEKQTEIAQHFALYFEDSFEDDKGSMIYNIYMKMWAICTFSCLGSNRNEERVRIGGRIKELRESKKMEAKGLAALANIDAANLSRIEHGNYSVGLDILSKIAFVLDSKIDFVPNQPTQNE